MRRISFRVLEPGLIAGLCMGLPAPAAAAAATMSDIKTHFASCFHPPGEAAGSRVTFYFSFNRSGGLIAEPRAVWFGFKGSQEDKARHVADFKVSFRRCLPVALGRDLAETIPGKVFFLQYIVASTGTSEVVLRPFGSHGRGGEPIPDLAMPESVPFASGPTYRSPPSRNVGPPVVRNPYLLRPRDAIRPRTPNPALRPLRP